MSGPRLVRVPVEDFALVWPVLEPVFRAGDSYGVDPDISEAGARAYWAPPDAVVHALMENGRALATSTLRPNHGGGGAHVCNAAFAVRPDARGRGLARAMADHAMRTAKAMGFTAMQFNFVIEANTAAVRLWRALGFVEIGRVPEGFRLPGGGVSDALIMHRRL